MTWLGALRHAMLGALGAAALVAGLLGGGAATMTVTVAERAASADVGATNAYAKAAFRASNTARANRDRRTLRGDACLRRAAQRQAARMARIGRMEHQDLGRIQRDCRVGWVGENVAYGYTSGSQLVWRGWMRSEGHRANILSRHFRLMGLAAVKDDDGRWWSAQVFGAR